jgi:hypothetical protein
VVDLHEAGSGGDHTPSGIGVRFACTMPDMALYSIAYPTAFVRIALANAESVILAKRNVRLIILGGIFGRQAISFAQFIEQLVSEGIFLGF